MKGAASCVVTATNNSFDDHVVDLTTTTNQNLNVLSASGASGRYPVRLQTTLSGAMLGVPSYGPGTSPTGGGVLPLSLFAAPAALGDETFLNYNVPAFIYNGQTWSRIGIDSNGYLVVGRRTSQDNVCCAIPGGPDPAPPNNVLAPFWTDLDGSNAPGVYVVSLTDGVSSWIAVEWDAYVWGTSDLRTFQVWIGYGGAQDISYTYSGAQADPNGQAFLVGAEMRSATATCEPSLPGGGDLVVTSSDPTPGGSTSYTVFVQGSKAGDGLVTTSMTATSVPGVTVVHVPDHRDQQEEVAFDRALLNTDGPPASPAGHLVCSPVRGPVALRRGSEPSAGSRARSASANFRRTGKMTAASVSRDPPDSAEAPNPARRAGLRAWRGRIAV